MYQYSFANVDLLITADYPARKPETPAQFKVQGYAVGENLIVANRRAPIATTMFGAYGDMVVNMQRIRAGDLTFPVLMNSPENTYLQEWANYFQQQADSDGQLISPIQANLVDTMGNDEADMTNGVILAMPAMTRGQQMSINTWVITFERMVFTRDIGGDLEQL